MSQEELLAQRVDSMLRKSGVFPAIWDKPVTRRQVAIFGCCLVVVQIATTAAAIIYLGILTI